MKNEQTITFAIIITTPIILALCEYPISSLISLFVGGSYFVWRGKIKKW